MQVVKSDDPERNDERIAYFFTLRMFKFNGAIDCAKQLVANEGVGAFFAGVSGRVGWLAPRCAIAVTAFEAIAKILSG